MLIFLALCLFIGFLISFSIPQLLPISSELHQLCLRTAPLTPWQEFYQAIVCGSDLSLSSEYTQLQELGLLHIIVVSGSHLIFFANSLSLLPLKSIHKIKPLFLFIFVLLSRMDPPIIRAFIFLYLYQICSSHKLFYNSYQILLGSVFFSIGLQPHWVCSRSLLLSWAASLGIHYGKNILSQSIFCYLLIFPLIADFSSHSFQSIIMNSTLTPLISYLLFPLSFLSFILPIESYTDSMWDIFFKVCKTINHKDFFGSLPNLSTLQLYLQWFYLLFLNFLGIELKKRGLL